MATPKTPRAKKIAAPAPPSAPAVTGKLADMLTALRSVDGATIDQLSALTGWQKHSVRGALAGALKKRGFTITSVKAEGVRTYRIAAPAGDQP